MATFVEGVDVIVQPCSFAIVVPALIAIVIARSSAMWAWVGFLVGASLMAWARAAGYWTVRGTGLLVILIGIVAAVAIVMAWRSYEKAAAAAIVLGAIAGWLWRPCVGIELADVLNNADTEGARTLFKMTVYLAGVTLPALVVAAIPIALPRAAGPLQSKSVARVGLVIGLLWAASIALGLYDDIVSELYKRSSA